MSFVLTADQELIRKTARELAAERLPIAHLRELRDAGDALGFSRERWREIAELGFAGALVPEQYGGAGLGLADVGLVLEEFGRTLAPTPLLSTGVIGASALLLGGTEEQRRAHLGALCKGERLFALAHDEGTRHARYGIGASATRDGERFVLRGEKSFVPDGGAADVLIVSARSAGASGSREGISLFLVPPGTAGVTITPLRQIDSRNAARVKLDGVKLDASALLGKVDHGADLLDALLDRGAVALAAEMLGGAVEVFERTLGYMKERKQFGVPIGSFQALKHRAAWLFCELELLRSIVMAALRAIDDQRADASQLAAVAKARASEVYVQVAAEAIQMHGGVGVTDEFDIGLFYKRARATELTFGDGAFHRDRFARMLGY